MSTNRKHRKILEKPKMAQLRGDEALGIHGPRPSGSASHTHTQAQKQALAGYYHASSTDADPKHSECPIGPDPYCFYNKALAEGRTPPSHNDMKVRFELEPRFLQFIWTSHGQIYWDDVSRVRPKILTSRSTQKWTNSARPNLFHCRPRATGSQKQSSSTIMAMKEVLLLANTSLQQFNIWRKWIKKELVSL